MRWEAVLTGYLILLTGLAAGLPTTQGADSSKRIQSDQAAAVISGGSTNAIDSATLQEFDKCRASIDFTKLSIDEVNQALTTCKEKAAEKSAPLENPNFTDVKQQIDKRMQN